MQDMVPGSRPAPPATPSAGHLSASGLGVGPLDVAGLGGRTTEAPPLAPVHPSEYSSPSARGHEHVDGRTGPPRDPDPSPPAGPTASAAVAARPAVTAPDQQSQVAPDQQGQVAPDQPPAGRHAASSRSARPNNAARPGAPVLPDTRTSLRGTPPPAQRARVAVPATRPASAASSTGTATAAATATATAAATTTAAVATVAAVEAEPLVAAPLALPLAIPASRIQRTDDGPQPTRPRAPSRPETVKGLHVGQLVTVEAAAVAGLVASTQPLPVLVPLAAVGGLAVLLSVVRVRGRWLYQWAGLRLRYAARRRRHAVDNDDLGLVRAVAPGAVLTTVEVGEDEAAVVAHAAGLAVVLEVSPTQMGRVVEASFPVPPMTALLPSADTDGPPVSVQVVMQTIPAPAFAGEGSSAAQSYQELTGGVLPARRRCWIALQALHTPDDDSELDLRAALTNAVLRVQRRLSKSRLRGRPLGTAEALAEYVALLRLDPSDDPESDQVRRLQETWSSWTSGSSAHTTYRVLDWPDLATAEGADIFEHLGAVPSVATTVSVAGRWRAEEVELEAAVRLTMPDATAAAAAGRALAAAAVRNGAGLQRLDGEQVFGVAASLPLGGFSL